MRPLPIVLGVFLSLSLWAGVSSAHHVGFSQQQQVATVLTVTDDSGAPLTEEAYKIYPLGETRAIQRGRTDARGRILFLPDGPGEWRLKVFSLDGHGVDSSFRTEAPTLSAEAMAHDHDEPGIMALLAGVGMLLGLFGIYQLFLGRRAPAE